MGAEGSNGLTTFYQNDSFRRLLHHADSLDFLHSNRTKQPADCKQSASSPSDHLRSLRLVGQCWRCGGLPRVPSDQVLTENARMPKGGLHYQMPHLTSPRSSLNLVFRATSAGDPPGRRSHASKVFLVRRC